jgi:hypothetical protein
MDLAVLAASSRECWALATVEAVRELDEADSTACELIFLPRLVEVPAAAPVAAALAVRRPMRAAERFIFGNVVSF